MSTEKGSGEGRTVELPFRLVWELAMARIASGRNGDDSLSARFAEKEKRSVSLHSALGSAVRELMECGPHEIAVRPPLEMADPPRLVTVWLDEEETSVLLVWSPRKEGS